ncbi:hypothetical protein ACFBZI_07530 [Moraxella sp. ZJ142]
MQLVQNIIFSLIVSLLFVLLINAWIDDSEQDMLRIAHQYSSVQVVDEH